jgi:hypothetical protein
MGGWVYPAFSGKAGEGGGLFPPVSSHAQGPSETKRHRGGVRLAQALGSNHGLVENSGIEWHVLCLVGAWLVAFELVSRFRGYENQRHDLSGSGNAGKDTELHAMGGEAGKVYVGRPCPHNDGFYCPDRGGLFWRLTIQSSRAAAGRPRCRLTLSRQRPLGSSVGLRKRPIWLQR